MHAWHYAGMAIKVKGGGCRIWLSNVVEILITEIIYGITVWTALLIILFIIFSINQLIVYFLKTQRYSVYYHDKGKQQIVTFETMKPANVWLMTQTDESIIEIVDDYFSLDWLIDWSTNVFSSS